MDEGEASGVGATDGASVGSSVKVAPGVSVVLTLGGGVT
jgi:hypothetical protein